MTLSRLVVFIISALLLSCSNIQKNIPVIDVFSDSNDTVQVKVSEITEAVNYLQLHFPLEMKDAVLSATEVIVGEKVIAIRISNMDRVFVFSEKSS